MKYLSVLAFYCLCSCNNQENGSQEPSERAQGVKNNISYETDNDNESLVSTTSKPDTISIVSNGDHYSVTLDAETVKEYAKKGLTPGGVFVGYKAHTALYKMTEAELHTSLQNKTLGIFGEKQYSTVARNINKFAKNKIGARFTMVVAGGALIYSVFHDGKDKKAQAERSIAKDKK